MSKSHRGREPYWLILSADQQTRFWSRVDKGDGSGCWLWTGSKSSIGYGATSANGYTMYAHTVAFELATRQRVPDGMVTDHLCRNRACVNPAHMEVVTQRENTLRGIGPTARMARKTHCHRGHLFTEDNLINERLKPGQVRPYRRCKLCNRINRKALIASGWREKKYR